MELTGAMEDIMLKECTGVVVGRFQVLELHEGHLHLLSTVHNACSKLVVIIGSTETPDFIKNPFDYTYRRSLILKWFPKAIVHGIFDYPLNEQWSGVLDAIVYTYPNVVLFGSRDCFMKDYNGENKCIRVPEIPGVSGTKIREELKNKK